MTALALVIAALATLWATISFLAGFNDFTTAVLLAILALGVVILGEHARYQREVRRQGREEVWRRRIEEDLGVHTSELPEHES